MIVFKSYFKIAKSFLPIIVIYTLIFTFFAIMSTSSNEGVSAFSSEKPNVTIINKDNDSILSSTFEKYIKTKSNIVVGLIDDEALRDSLFYRETDYIITIPDGFGSSLMSGNLLMIETMKVPNSYNSTYAEMLFNRFLNVANIYAKSGIDEKTISNIILDDLKDKSNVELLENKQKEFSKVNMFYNFANYTILAICIFIVGILINIFNNKNIKKRNLVSVISYKSINRQLFLGNACIATFIWFIYVLISIVLYKELMFSINALLIILNSFVFTFVALSIGFLIGNIVKSKEAQNGIVNIIALGSSFICGAFVPLEYLGNFVISIARFMPSYWYIKNNNDIALLSNYDFTSMSPIIINIVFMILFGIALFIITNLISKSKLKDN